MSIKTQVDWSFGWEYQLCQLIGIFPFGLFMLIGGGWWVLLPQILGFVGMEFFYRQDLARMRRESAEILRRKYGGSYAHQSK